MIILIHVIIALTSMVSSSVTFFKPSVKKLAISYGFIVATVGTGTYLLLNATGSILRTCLVGLFYLTVVSAATVAAHVRLQRVSEVPASTDQ
jgi:uncharacterized membrane protein YGL010W